MLHLGQISFMHVKSNERRERITVIESMKCRISFEKDPSAIYGHRPFVDKKPEANFRSVTICGAICDSHVEHANRR